MSKEVLGGLLEFSANEECRLGGNYVGLLPGKKKKNSKKSRFEVPFLKAIPRPLECVSGGKEVSTQGLGQDRGAHPPNPLGERNRSREGDCAGRTGGKD